METIIKLAGRYEDYAVSLLRKHFFSAEASDNTNTDGFRYRTDSVSRYYFRPARLRVNGYPESLDDFMKRHEEYAQESDELAWFHGNEYIRIMLPEDGQDLIAKVSDGLADAAPGILALGNPV